MGSNIHHQCAFQHLSLHMQEYQYLRLWTQGPHKNLTTSIPSNASNEIHHEHIKEFTHMSHIIHKKTNQETKTSTSITRNTKTNNQISTMSKELDSRLKWDQDTTYGHLAKSMGNQGFCHCSKASKGFNLGLGQGQKGSSDTNNHKLNTNNQGLHKGAPRTQ